MRIHPILFAAAATLSLAACSQAKESLGLTRSAPDEFAVVTRAPLEMPPDFALRPPRPGAPRPQEANPSLQAQSALFGAVAPADDGFTESEAVLLDHAGAYIANPDIRQIVDAETAATAPREQTVAKRLLNIGSDKAQEPAARVVDPVAERERLLRNEAEGRPVTEGETPSVER